MDIAVVGLGSMGKRRIRLLREMYPSHVLFGIDGRDDRRKEASDLFGIVCYKSLNESDVRYDCVFVCTSPLSHSSIINQALNLGCNVFTELNLVSDGYDENLALAAQKGLHLFLSSTFLYRDEIQFIRNKVKAAEKQPWNYIYHIGQYLPDWHPWESYNDFFLGDKRTNGCREIMAIELPWLTTVFGKVKDIHVMSDKITDLKIDYKDNFMILLSHVNGNKGCLIVDVVSPHPVRKFEAYRQNAFLSWEGTPDSLKYYDPDIRDMKTVAPHEKTEHIDGYRSFVVENAYKNEIKEFFSVVLNGHKSQYGFEQDREILELIDSIGA